MAILKCIFLLFKFWKKSRHISKNMSGLFSGLYGWNLLIALKSFQRLWKVSRYFEKFPDTLKSFQILWKVSKYSENFPDTKVWITWFSSREEGFSEWLSGKFLRVKLYYIISFFFLLTVKGLLLNQIIKNAGHHIFLKSLWRMGWDQYKVYLSTRVQYLKLGSLKSSMHGRPRRRIVDNHCLHQLFW